MKALVQFQHGSVQVSAVKNRDLFTLSLRLEDSSSVELQFDGVQLTALLDVADRVYNSGCGFMATGWTEPVKMEASE